MAYIEDDISRRTFVAGLLGTTLVGAIETLGVKAQAGRARVVRVESPRVWQGNRRAPDVVAEMVTRGVMTLSGASRPADAWGRYVKPGMRVGLKVNLLGRPLVFTAHEVTDAVVSGVILAGVSPDRILVWDRRAEHFGPGTYQPGRGSRGEQIAVGGDYGTTAARTTGGPVPLDRIPADRTDITINLPVIKHHGGPGVTLSLKNIAFGCYRHHDGAHGGGCEPYITEACAHFLATVSMPLVVLDATEGCFDGGPAPGSPDMLWRESAVYVGTDPVAIDAVCRDLLMARRRLAGLADTTSRSRHIDHAAARGLGVGDRSLIDVITVTVP